MAQHRRKRHWHVACPGDGIGVADAGRHNPYQDLAARWFTQLNLLLREGRVFLLNTSARIRIVLIPFRPSPPNF